jgi:hypothetical protein
MGVPSEKARQRALEGHSFNGWIGIRDSIWYAAVERHRRCYDQITLNVQPGAILEHLEPNCSDRKVVVTI